MTSTSGCITFVNAGVGGTNAASLRIAGARIAAVGTAGCPGDLVVDLQGDRLLPVWSTRTITSTSTHYSRSSRQVTGATCASGFRKSTCAGAPTRHSSRKLP